MSLLYREGVGAHEYIACVAGPEPKAGRASGIPTLRSLNPQGSFPAGGLEVDVPEGAVNITAALRDLEGKVPPDVTVTITAPDGTAYTETTKPYAEGTVVEIQGGSLVGLLVLDPEPGGWKIEIESSNERDEFAFWFSTMPTADVQGTIDATLSRMADPERLKEVVAGLKQDESLGCLWCTIGCWALAVLIAGLLAAGAAYITAGAAPVVALAGLIGWSAAATAAQLLGLLAAGGTAIGIVLAHICHWAGACSSAAGTADVGMAT